MSGRNANMMTSPLPAGEVRVGMVLFTMQWRLMSQILLALPVVGMFICLITSLIFHSDHINNTICKVYNFLPSISAVTGVSPQRYLWRVAVALHISPRLLVAWVARAYYKGLADHVPPARRPSYLTLVTAAFYLNLTELATLCGVTYISNKENYPVHEKLFTLFMLVSLVYMLCVIRVVRAVKHTLSPRLLSSFAQKKWLFGIKLASTGGLLFFFWRHRVFCQPMAFSWFSLCEYIIATCNMLYHVSVALDFSDEHLIVGHIIPTTASTTSTTVTSTSISSLSTTASSSRHHSASTPTTCDSLMTCEGGPDTPPTRNGRLEDPLVSGNPVPAGPHPLAPLATPLHAPLPPGKGVETHNPDSTVDLGWAGPAGCGGPSAGGTIEVESTPTVVHQVLNTIHESAEPPSPQTCLNGPADKETRLVQRRPQNPLPNSHSSSSNNSPTKHAHTE